MKDEAGNRTTRPTCLLRTEYVEPFKRAWPVEELPVDRMTSGLWSKYGWEAENAA